MHRSALHNCEEMNLDRVDGLRLGQDALLQTMQFL